MKKQKTWQLKKLPLYFRVYFGAFLKKLLRILTNVDAKTNEGRMLYIRKIIERFSELGVGTLSSSLAYYLMFAIFPFVIFLTSLVVSFGGRFITAEMLVNFKALLPEQIASMLSGIVKTARGGSYFAAASLGLIALVWSASRGVSVLMYSMDIIYENPRNTATFFLQQILGFFSTALMGVILLFTTVTMALGATLLSSLERLLKIDLENFLFANNLNYLLSLILLSIIFSIIYYLSSRRRGRYRYAFFCGFLSSLFWVLLTFGFSFYITTSTRYSILYGSMTSFIFLMLWLYFCSFLLMLVALVHRELIVRFESRQVAEQGGAKPLDISSMRHLKHPKNFKQGIKRKKFR